MDIERLKSHLGTHLGQATFSRSPDGARPGAGKALRRVVWAFALFTLLVWSLLAWGAHLLVSGGAGLLQGQLHWFEAYAWLEPWLSGGLGITEGVMLALTWIVWAVGALFIAMGAWLVPKALGLFGNVATR